jgi:hypothetical protein
MMNGSGIKLFAGAYIEFAFRWQRRKPSIDKTLQLYIGTSHPELAEIIARRCGSPASILSTAAKELRG